MIEMEEDVLAILTLDTHAVALLTPAEFDVVREKVGKFGFTILEIEAARAEGLAQLGPEVPE